MPVHKKGQWVRYPVQLYVVLLLFFSFSPTAIAQDFIPAPFDSIGGAFLLGPPYPPGVDWKKIDSSDYEFIFPEGSEEAALKAVEAAEYAAGRVARDLETEVPPLPLIVNTFTPMANGYFTLAPRRTEWYSYNTQRQFAGPVDWYRLLALHEGRHAAQFSALKSGFTRFARWIAGEYGWSFLAMYSMPLWFFEGDAIMAETLYTEAGRGRSASFHRELRAIVEEGEDVSYNQAYLGSYRTHFPNHYHLGFPLVAYIRLRYGQDAWNEIIRKTSRFSFWPLRFYSAVTSVTGSEVPEIYEEALSFYGDYFTSLDDPAFSESRGEVFRNLPSPGWTNYLPLFEGEEGVLYALRYGDESADTLVRIVGDSSSAKVLDIRPVLAAERQISVSPGKAVWTEYYPHPLWSKLSSRDLVLLDLETNRRRRLTVGGSYQAPALSPEGDRIAAVHALPGGGAELRILSADDGELLSRYPIEGEDLFILSPAWAPDGDRVAAIHVEGGKSSVVEYELSRGKQSLILGPLDETLSQVAYLRDKILYVSERFGREKIEAVDRVSGRRYLIASGLSSSSGSVAAVSPVPSMDGGRLFFADYTLQGFRPAELSIEAETLVELPPRGGGRIDYIEAITGEIDGAVEREASGPPERGEIRDYSRLSHMLNVHSWGLMPTGDGRAQAFVQSDDVLGTLSLQAFTGFAPRRNSYDAGVQGIYRGIFPLLRFGVSADTTHPGDPDKQWNGITSLLGFEAPFDLSRGIWMRRLSVGSTAYMRYEEARPQISGDAEKMVLPFSHRLSFSNASKAIAPIDFASPWAQYMELNWMHLPFHLEEEGTRLVSRGLLTFPGLFPHHRIFLSADAEWKEGATVPLDYPFVRPRGYPFDWSESYRKDLVVGMEYALPLVYPDLALGQVYYLKRMRLNLFTELGLGLPRGGTVEELPSFIEKWEAELGADLHPVSGVELLFEQHLFSWPVALEAGLRVVYRWREEAFRLEHTVFTFGVEW